MHANKTCARGFMLVEIIVALTLVALALSATLMYQARTRAVDDARETATAIDAKGSRHWNPQHGESHDSMRWLAGTNCAGISLRRL